MTRKRESSCGMTDRLPSLSLSGGVLSRTGWHLEAIGPYLYVERSGFMVHLWLRYFRSYGVRWGYTLRLRDRHVLFGGRR